MTSEQSGPVTVRLVMPDRWLEHRVELASSTPVATAKEQGLRALLQRDTDDPADFYVEYAERQISDESLSLDEIGFQPRDSGLRPGSLPPLRGLIHRLAEVGTCLSDDDPRQQHEAYQVREGHQRVQHF